jgi:uridine phosphorylase
MQIKGGKIKFEGLPLSEFDPDRFALLEPTARKNIKLPEHGVIPFYGPVINTLVRAGRLTQVHELGSIMTPIKIYRVDYDRKPVTVVCPPGCGGALAGGILEELIAYGCRKVVACGSAGCLKPDLCFESIVIPSAAIRDEGTSYHYLPPSRTVTAEPAVIARLEEVLKKHHVSYQVGLDWTTDAPYRETRQKIARRRAEGCLTVEMEFASMLAVARFRKVLFGQYLLAGDDVSGNKWDSRGCFKASPAHEKIFWLAVEACLNL